MKRLVGRVNARPKPTGSGISGRPAVLAGSLVFALACLAGVISVAAAPAEVDVAERRARLAQITERQVNAEAILADQRADRSLIADQVDELLSGRGTEAEAVARILTEARSLAVAAYIRGEIEPVQFLLDADNAALLAWSRSLSVDRATGAQVAASEFIGMRAEADQETLAAAERLDLAQRRVAEAAHHVGQLEDEAQALRNEIAAAEQAAAARVRSAVVVRSQPSGDRVDPTPEQWRALRHCEATGNYGAVSPNGRYRGAYQFDLRTWQSVGGSGDPAAAPPAEQDARALTLFRSRGAGPWPVCGRFLPRG